MKRSEGGIRMHRARISWGFGMIEVGERVQVT